MKTIIIATIITCLIITAVFCITPVTVAEVNEDLVTVETTDGNLWDFYGDGYHAGDHIWIFMIGDMILMAGRG